MDQTLDDFAKELQDQIFEEAKDVYGAKAFDRWLNPAHMGVIKEPDGYARLKGKCGDTMEIFLIFENDFVREASYVTDGCASSNICGSYAVELAIGKNPDEIILITGESILDELGDFPQAEHHCAFLAAETLQEALDNYMIKTRKS